MSRHLFGSVEVAHPIHTVEAAHPIHTVEAAHTQCLHVLFNYLYSDVCNVCVQDMCRPWTQSIELILRKLAQAPFAASTLTLSGVQSTDILRGSYGHICMAKWTLGRSNDGTFGGLLLQCSSDGHGRPVALHHVQ